jgi:hypothetical protein
MLISPLVIAGLVPAIPIIGAGQCLPKRDGRHKAGHDEAGGVCVVGRDI